MAEAVVMPKAGLTMDSGEVLEWFVSVGDEVKAGQPLVEVGTYKADIEVESPVAGVLLAALEPGAEVPPGTVIGVVGERDEDIASIPLGSPSGEAAEAPESERASDPAADLEQPPRPARREGGPSVSPAARKRARELGVDVQSVRGSGPRGRVRVEDVERAAGESAG
jgi:pyruvate dehydrogenase E2 component (dihydrolipoamide acetyltransferase)